jgi:hypothetical protein
MTLGICYDIPSRAIGSIVGSSELGHANVHIDNNSTRHTRIVGEKN